MAVTNQQIFDFLLANPGLSDAELASLMETYGVSPAQMSAATGTPESEIIARAAATVPYGSSVTLGDTVVSPQYEVRGSGEDQQVLGIQSIYTAKAGDNGAAGTTYQEYSPTGEFQRTGVNQEVGSFFGGLVDAFKDPVVQAALLGVAGGAGAFDGLFGGTTAGTAAGTVGTTGLTTAELAQLDLALGGAGGTAGAEALASALTTGAAVPTLTNLTGGSGIGTGITGANGAFLGEGVPTGIEAWDTAFTSAGGLLNPAFSLGADGLVGTPIVNTPIVSTPTITAPTVTTPTVTPTAPVVPTTPTVPPVVPPTTPSVIPSLPTGLTPSVISALTGLLGGTVINKAITPSTAGTPAPVSIPTQGIPLNSQDYFNAIQQNYNQIMPAMPRDVASPLAAWYNSQYGA